MRKEESKRLRELIYWVLGIVILLLLAKWGSHHSKPPESSVVTAQSMVESARENMTLASETNSPLLALEQATRASQQIQDARLILGDQHLEKYTSCHVADMVEAWKKVRTDILARATTMCPALKVKSPQAFSSK